MLSDIDQMPFGKFIGTPLQDVPVNYLHYLWTAANFSKIKLDKVPDNASKHQINSFQVAEYINRNLDVLKDENDDLIWK